jgi:hypothetical protein
VRSLQASGSADIGAGVHVHDLATATEFLGREIGIAQSQTTGSLRAVLGTENGLYPYMRTADEAWVAHTHPVYVSEPGHFTTDVRTATSRIEAVVDMSATREGWQQSVTHFNNTGLLTNPAASPINRFGYVVGH